MGDGSGLGAAAKWKEGLQEKLVSPLVLVGTAGFELATPCTPCKCATRLRYAPKLWLLQPIAMLMTKLQISKEKDSSTNKNRLFFSPPGIQFQGSECDCAFVLPGYTPE